MVWAQDTAGVVQLDSTPSVSSEHHKQKLPWYTHSLAPCTHSLAPCPGNLSTQDRMLMKSRAGSGHVDRFQNCTSESGLYNRNVSIDFLPLSWLVTGVLEWDSHARDYYGSIFPGPVFLLSSRTGTKTSKFSTPGSRSALKRTTAMSISRHQVTVAPPNK